ncbi:MAG: hypothetical protein LBG60_04815 [Bifidobacteriaceae bacterium]|jgi:hypothetical protein|nr:hypothetical protein [Bifidobacteriaceae bacterium]
MAQLPSSENSLLVRTDFDDDAAWLRLRAAVEGAGGFAADVEPVDDPAWDGADWTEVQDAALAQAMHADVLFIADTDALAADYPIQAVDLTGEDRAPFRCLAAVLWTVDANLNSASTDWEEFVEAADSDGVFSGLD